MTPRPGAAEGRRIVDRVERVLIVQWPFWDAVMPPERGWDRDKWLRTHGISRVIERRDVPVWPIDTRRRSGARKDGSNG